MLVWVACYPRSGNTLTMLVLRDVFGISRVAAVYGRQVTWGFAGNLEELPPTLESAASWQPPEELANLRDDDLLDALRQHSESYFVKTHLRSKAADSAPALYLVRDGRDALVSHAHLVQERPRFRDMNFDRRLAALIHPGIRAQGGWSGNVRAWRRRSAPTAIARFEDLIDDPVAVVTGACAELGIPLPEPAGELRSFSELHESYPSLFRRGMVGAWRDEMPPHLQERFWRVHGAEMEALGYTKERLPAGNPGIGN